MSRQISEYLTQVKDMAVIAHNLRKIVAWMKKSPYLCSVKRTKSACNRAAQEELKSSKG